MEVLGVFGLPDPSNSPSSFHDASFFSAGGLVFLCRPATSTPFPLDTVVVIVVDAVSFVLFMCVWCFIFIFFFPPYYYARENRIGRGTALVMRSCGLGYWTVGRLVTVSARHWMRVVAAVLVVRSALRWRAARVCEKPAAPDGSVRRREGSGNQRLSTSHFFSISLHVVTHPPSFPYSITMYTRIRATHTHILHVYSFRLL